MSVTFSTKLVPVADRLDAWQWNAQRLLASVTIRSSSLSFFGLGLRDFFEGLWRTRAAGLQRSNNCLSLSRTSTLPAPCFLRSLLTPQSRSRLGLSATT